MILDSILLIFYSFLNLILLPLEVINIGIDFFASIPVVTSFLQVIAYILPWTNLLPLFVILIASFTFRIILALIKTIWNFVPFV